MVLDLMTQLDREFTERNKIETLLRELLGARRSRKSEQLSADQLALFAAEWQARQAEAEAPAAPHWAYRPAPAGIRFSSRPNRALRSLSCRTSSSAIEMVV